MGCHPSGAEKGKPLETLTSLRPNKVGGQDKHMSTVAHESHSYAQTHAHTSLVTQVWWHMLVTQPLGGMLRQEDWQEFKARLDYVVCMR